MIRRASFALLLAAPAALAAQAKVHRLPATPATVAWATVIDAFTNSGTTSYSLSDTAGHLVAALPSVANNAINITATTPATIIIVTRDRVIHCPPVRLIYDNLNGMQPAML